MNTPKDNINTSRTQEQLREEIKSLTKDNDLYCVAEIPVFFNKKTNQAYSYINGKRQTM
jgi:dephospho-CoA kinase